LWTCGLVVYCFLQEKVSRFNRGQLVKSESQDFKVWGRNFQAKSDFCNKGLLFDWVRMRHRHVTPAVSNLSLLDWILLLGQSASPRSLRHSDPFAQTVRSSVNPACSYRAQTTCGPRSSSSCIVSQSKSIVFCSQVPEGNISFRLLALEMQLPHDSDEILGISFCCGK